MKFCLLGLGVSFCIGIGLYAQAVPDPAKAADLDPDSIALENNLGVAYAAVGDSRKAQEVFHRAVETDPASALSLANLASVEFNTSEYELAEQDARRAVSLNPRSVDARITLAVAQVAQGKWTEDARECLEENRTYFPQAVPILRNWPQRSSIQDKERSEVR